MKWTTWLRHLYRSVVRTKSMFREKPKVVVTYMYRHDLTYFPPVKVRWEGKVEIRRMGIEDMPLLREVWPVSLQRMYKRLRRGDRCYSVFLDGQIVMYLWFQTAGWHYIQPAGRWMRVRSEEIICYHERVAEWAQGRRISPFCYVSVLGEFREAGYQRAWVYTTADNIASQRSKQYSGWSLASKYRALVWGPLRLPLF